MRTLSQFALAFVLLTAPLFRSPLAAVALGLALVYAALWYGEQCVDGRQRIAENDIAARVDDCR